MKGDDAADRWARVVRSFVGHVSEVLGGTSDGHDEFERLLRVEPLAPKHIHLWNILTGLLLTLLDEHLKPEPHFMDADAKACWERFLIWRRNIRGTPLDLAENRAARGQAVCPDFCHPDSESPAIYLEGHVTCFGQRLVDDGNDWIERWNPIIKKAVLPVLAGMHSSDPD